MYVIGLVPGSKILNERRLSGSAFGGGNVRNEGGSSHVGNPPTIGYHLGRLSESRLPDKTRSQSAHAAS